MVDPVHPEALAGLRGACVFSGEVLPDPLPAEPFGLFTRWLADATGAKAQPNPNAMTLATVDADGGPSTRIVLARGVNVERGYVVFFTNYRSRKGREIDANPRVSLCFHWDHLDRQVRIEGHALRSPASESDAYFAGRPALSRIAAWASDQSEPIASRDALIEKNRATEEHFGVLDAQAKLDAINVPRPGHWGGFRVWARRVELWRGHTNRLHDRAVWTRKLSETSVDGVPGMAGDAWTITRLQP